MNKCENCKEGVYQDFWLEEYVQVNLHGEYVKGYGNTPVFKSASRCIDKCPKCGHIKGKKIKKL